MIASALLRRGSHACQDYENAEQQFDIDSRGTPGARHLVARRVVDEGLKSRGNQYAGVCRPMPFRRSRLLRRVSDCIAALGRVRKKLAIQTASSMQSVRAEAQADFLFFEPTEEDERMKRKGGKGRET